MQINQEVLDLLKKYASQGVAHADEDFNPSDTGNYDDTYWIGVSSGEAALATELLGMLNAEASEATKGLLTNSQTS
jgi:hypothetical protein